MPTTLTVEEGELPALIKSLSISYDALLAKMNRLKQGRHYDEALHEFRLVDSVLARCRALQSDRL